jgi:DNA-binding GntR family transcriptional regulator
MPFARQIASIIRERIIHGEIANGERIIENALSEQLRISRTPLREALKLLEAEGLVEISQNKGARVTSFTVDEARNLFEVIAGLESMAAELAVARIDGDQLRDLEMIHNKMLAYYAEGDTGRYFELNSQVHDWIVRASANPILIATHANLVVRARRGRYMAIFDADRWRQAVEEHDSLMSSLRTKDSESARKVWRLHLLNTGKAVCRALSEVRTSSEGLMPGGGEKSRRELD